MRKQETLSRWRMGDIYNRLDNGSSMKLRPLSVPGAVAPSRRSDTTLPLPLPAAEGAPGLVLARPRGAAWVALLPVANFSGCLLSRCGLQAIALGPSWFCMRTSIAAWGSRLPAHMRCLRSSAFVTCFNLYKQIQESKLRNDGVENVCTAQAYSSFRAF